MTQLAFNENPLPVLWKPQRNGQGICGCRPKERLSERASKTRPTLLERLNFFVEKLTVLNEYEVPPFTIEDESDGDDLRI